ncbi:MAG TPA: hypothetical protein VNO81_10225 [Candidatus Nitrosotenuis sp.]|nr:hypothetical protein [Candidatus Nitrosotenuis sp.]
MIDLVVEDFPAGHPGINGQLFVEEARVALSRHHTSPAPFEVRHSGSGNHSARVHFAEPDPRSAHSRELHRFAEDGAIVVAGLLLGQFEGLQLVRTVPRGQRVDYFVGRTPFEETGVVEISGTFERPIQQLLRDKRYQLGRSPHRQGPTPMPGYVAVTRFAPEAVSVLEAVP